MTGPVGPTTRQDAAALLDVDPAAGTAEVQRAFLRAARRVHPDVLPDAGDAERREAAAAFDRLLRARDLLLAEPPVGPVPVPEGAPARRPEGRGLGGSLVVLALLAFLLVLLVTVQQGLRGDASEPGAPVAPRSSASP